MLKELSIRNFAIIDDLTIRFAEGLTILSGETGAGKSIILGAVNLLLGSRASSDMVRTGAESAELEALFHVSAAGNLTDTLASHGFDTDEGLVIRRIISRTDSNRVYINGRLATIAVLNAVTDNLASISGQHAHQGLLKDEQQLVILDQFGDLLALRQQVHDTYQRILPLIEKLQKLQRTRQRQAEHMELLEFQQAEIQRTRLQPGEDVELEQEQLRLKNAQMLYQTVFGSIEELYGASGSIIERLLEVKKNLDRAGRVDVQLKSTADNLAAAAYQIEDLVEALRSHLGLIQMDDGRLESIEERLDTLNRLKRKYGGSLDAVLSRLAEIELELSQAAGTDEKIQQVEIQLTEQHNRLVEQARELSQKRKTTATVLAKRVAAELDSLKMAGTKFEAALRPITADEKTSTHLQADGQAILETGMDRVTFMIAPNPGEALKPLAGIASGGELSRVVLALKAILAQSDAVETIVFDEVDAGIGGGTAEVVGRKLAALAKHHQVICITHLPQIAKFGDQHFSIAKQVVDGRTLTTIRPLNEKDRQREIARMLGGERITRTTLAHARELMEK